MPRIAVCTNYADREKPQFSGENEHLDFCRGCYPCYAAWLPSLGTPMEAVDRGCGHPPYEGESYTCYYCGRTLAERDN